MSLLLLIAAVLASIQYLAHAGLFLRAKPQHGRDEIDLLERMKGQRWKFNGFQRSYWGFYFGYGLLAILWGFVEVAILWQLVFMAGFREESGRITASLIRLSGSFDLAAMSFQSRL